VDGEVKAYFKLTHIDHIFGVIAISWTGLDFVFSTFRSNSLIV